MVTVIKGLVIPLMAIGIACILVVQLFSALTVLIWAAVSIWGCLKIDRWVCYHETMNK